MRILKFLMVLIFVSGCSTISALNRLQDLSVERDEQQILVKEQEKKFEQLLKDFSSGKIEKGNSKDKIIEKYGEPITIKDVKTDSFFSEELMYRHPAQFFGSEKIYLYFDKDGKLLESRIEK